jgi:plastocyanin
MRLAAFTLLAFLTAVPLSAAAGTVTGRVVFREEVPTVPPIRVTKDQDACGQEVPQDVLLVSPTTRGVQYAVVALEGVPLPEGGAPAASQVTLENRNCRFAPHVLAAQVGSELAVVNADPVLHNLRAWSAERRALLNVVQPTQGQVTRRPLRRAGAFTLTCDAHAHMHGYLHVFEHPYFAVTDPTGTFRIRGVPPGTYRLTAWHEGWVVVKRELEGRPIYEPPHVVTQDVVVPATGEIRLRIELPSRP